MSPELLLRTVKEISREAGCIALSYFKDLKENNSTKKIDGSPLTNADVEVDAYIKNSLRSRTSYEQILSEEDAVSYLKKGTYWVVDPIDGTQNFIEKNTAYAISIALVEDGVVTLGVVYAPSLGKTYAAAFGLGATCNDIPIMASVRTTLSGATVLLDNGTHERTVIFHSSIRKSLLDRGARTKAIECASLELVALSEGFYDGFVHRGLHAWDIAAGMVIAKESGILVLNLEGGAKSLFETGIVASTDTISPLLVSITKQALDEEASAN